MLALTLDYRRRGAGAWGETDLRLRAAALFAACMKVPRRACQFRRTKAGEPVAATPSLGAYTAGAQRASDNTSPSSGALAYTSPTAVIAEARSERSLSGD